MQTSIIQVRARLVRETTGPKGLEGFYFAAMLQHVLDWITLAEDDREGFSNFLESEEQRHRAGSDKDAMQHRQSFQTMESRRTDDDYMVLRAHKTIPTAELRQLFMHKLKVSAPCQPSGEERAKGAGAHVFMLTRRGDRRPGLPAWPRKGESRAAAIAVIWPTTRTSRRVQGGRGPLSQFNDLRANM